MQAQLLALVAVVGISVTMKHTYLLQFKGNETR
jgi:hypothetical protein